MTTPLYDPLSIARQFLYVRESSTQNRGLRVESIQHWSGGQFGDSWCCEMLWMWFDIAYQGAPPFDREQSCQDLRVTCEKSGWIVERPQRGDIVLSINAAGLAHHVGMVSAVVEDGTLLAIAGNTSADGTSDNGDRVAEHAISSANKVFARVV